MIDLIEFLRPASWVFWFVAGAALFALEVLLPTFLALGFGIGAWLVSAVIFLLGPDDLLSVPVILAIWAILSALSWIALRIAFRGRPGRGGGSGGDINEY